MTYPAESVFEEVAYVAYHFGWSRDEILDLEHAERREYVGRIARLNTRGRAGVTGGCGRGARDEMSRSRAVAAARRR